MTKKINYEEAPMSLIHKKVFFMFALGQIACSYALGVAGAGLVAAQEPLGLNSFWMGLLGAGTLIGLFASVYIGQVSDKKGRQKLFNIDMALFTILSLLQFCVSNLFLLFIIRIGIGVTVAIDYTAGSALLTEWLPKKESPKYQSYLLIFWMIGFIASYVVGILPLGSSDNVWRLIMCSSAIFGVVAWVGRLIIKIPESPSWLQNKGNEQEALKLIQENLGENYVLPEIIITDDEKVSWKELFSPEVRKSTIVGGMFYCCQVFPFFGVSIFLPVLMEAMNVSNPMASGMVYNVFLLVGTIIGIWLCNNISRRNFLIYTFYGAAISLVGMIIFNGMSSLVVMVFFSIFAVILSAAVVLENPYPPELFDTRLRGSGVGVSITISRIGAAAGTFLLPIITTSCGVQVALGVCCIVLVIGGIICQLWAPETQPKFKK